MLKQKKLNQLSTGDDVNHLLLLTKVELKTTKNNKEYLNLELQDSSASFNAKLWENFQDLLEKSESTKIVKVEGKIEDYMGQTQIRINKIKFVNASEELSIEDFLPKSKRDLEEMIKEFNSTIDSVDDKNLRALLKNIFRGERFEKFKRVPAGKSWHHSYIHGLLEHTLEMVKICELICSFHVEVNRDLLITGTLLHDYGKIEELTANTNFEYTDKGRLLGHIVIAAIVVEEAVKQVKGFSESLKNQLIHLILSHQGKLEYASPVEPKTLEAIILYHADELSAKSNAYKNAILTGSDGKSSWTKYLPLANTALYIPGSSDTAPSSTESLFDI